MSKAILLSIHPKWAQKIYSGEKTIEWRKTLPNGNQIMVYLYETAPVKKITGFFILNASIKVYAKSNVINMFKWENGRIGLGDLIQYQGRKPFIYGWMVPGAIPLKEPKSLTYFGLKRPPQSWQYVEAY